MEAAVRRVRPGDADRLREVRLSALRDAPSAFASSFETEVVLPAAAWAETAEARSTGTDDATFLAEVGPDCVGLVGAFRPPGRPGVVELVSMWVAPELRRRGIGRLLVEQAVAWARDTGAGAVELWVTQGNDAAIAMYRSSGFTLKNEHQPLPSDPCRDEVRMVLEIPSSSAG
ncbi:MAG: GNAT family N-acetyltransferase [Acidimicrobiales bacterium]|jgi:GNAT superfamily N-acetyltransferase